MEGGWDDEEVQEEVGPAGFQEAEWEVAQEWFG